MNTNAFSRLTMLLLLSWSLPLVVSLLRDIGHRPTTPLVRLHVPRNRRSYHFSGPECFCYAYIPRDRQPRCVERRNSGSDDSSIFFWHPTKRVDPPLRSALALNMQNIVPASHIHTPQDSMPRFSVQSGDLCFCQRQRIGSDPVTTNVLLSCPVYVDMPILRMVMMR